MKHSFVSSFTTLICIHFFTEKKGKEKKNVKKVDPPPLGFNPQIFEQNFRTHNFNFEGN